jgi:hypothetical protein
LLYEALNALQHDEKARLMENILPAVALYWSDEGLRLNELAKYSPADRHTFHLLLSIRAEIWRGHELCPEHAVLWQEALSKCPDWPAFRRLEADAHLLERQSDLEERVYRFLQGSS